MSQTCSMDLANYVRVGGTQKHLQLNYLAKEVILSKNKGESPEVTIYLDPSCKFAPGKKAATDFEIQSPKLKKPLKVSTDSADLANRWISYMENSQNGNLTPEQRKEKAERMRAAQQAQQAQQQAQQAQQAQQGNQQQATVGQPQQQAPQGGPPVNRGPSQSFIGGAPPHLNQGGANLGSSAGGPPGGRPVRPQSVSLPRPTDGKTLVEMFVQAAWDGQLNEVKQFLAHPQINGMINAPGSKGVTALYAAARNGHIGVVLELLHFEGVDVNFQHEQHGGSPLHAACYNQRAECVAALLVKGANPELPNTQGTLAREEATGTVIEVMRIFDEEGTAGLFRAFPILQKLNKNGPTQAELPSRPVFTERALDPAAPVRPTALGSPTLGPITDSRPPHEVPEVRPGTFLIVFPELDRGMVAFSDKPIKESLIPQLERRGLTLAQVLVKTADHRVIPPDMPINEIPNACCFITHYTPTQDSSVASKPRSSTLLQAPLSITPELKALNEQLTDGAQPSRPANAIRGLSEPTAPGMMPIPEVREGTFVIVFAGGDKRTIALSTTNTVKEALAVQIERRNLTFDKIVIKTADHRIIPLDFPLSDIPNACCFVSEAAPGFSERHPVGPSTPSPVGMPEIPEVRPGTFLIVFQGGDKKTVQLTATSLKEALDVQLERRGLVWEKVIVRTVERQTISGDTLLNSIPHHCCFVSDLPGVTREAPSARAPMTDAEREAKRQADLKERLAKEEAERKRIQQLREQQRLEQEQWEREQEKKRAIAESKALYEQTEEYEEEDLEEQERERERTEQRRLKAQVSKNQKLQQNVGVNEPEPEAEIEVKPVRKRRNPFQKLGYEPVENGADLKKRITDMYARYEAKLVDGLIEEEFKEKKLDTALSFSGICMTYYPAPELGRPGWKIEKAKPEQIIYITGPEELFQSEEGDQTFILVASEVNVICVRFVAELQQWFLLMAEGDTVNLAFNTADMLPEVFPWDPIYSLVINGLPKRIILKIEQQVRPRLPLEPEQQERVKKLNAFFQSIAAISAHMMKFTKALTANNKIYALEEIRQFSTNSTAGPIIYNQVIPALTEVLMDGFDEWTLFGTHTPWDYVYACTTNDAVSDHVQLQFNTSIAQIKNNKKLSAPKIALCAFFCAGITHRQLGKWMKLLFKNRDQTIRFFKSDALWLIANQEILDLIQYLDGLPLSLTGTPPGAEEAQQAELDLLAQYAEELANEARAELDAKLEEYGIELPVLADHVDVEQLEKDFEQTKTNVATQAAALAEAASATYAAIEPDLIFVKDQLVDRANRIFDKVSDYFFSDDAYLDD